MKRYYARFLIAASKQVLTIWNVDFKVDRIKLRSLKDTVILQIMELLNVSGITK